MLAQKEAGQLRCLKHCWGEELIYVAQEYRWRGALARMLEGREWCHKFFWVGNELGTGIVGMLLAEKWIGRVFEVKHLSDYLMILKLVVGEVGITTLSFYAPQS